MPKIVDKKDFLKKANEIHNFKYDYSLIEYTKVRDYVIIICPRHGEFTQSFSQHIHNKCGCNKCGREDYGIRQRDTQEQFIKKANLKHNNKYDYSLVNFIDYKTKVTIICPLHGNFSQRPVNHINQCAGCFKCREVGWTRTAWKNSSKGKLVKLYLILCWNENEKFYKIGITNRTLLSRFRQQKSMPYSYKIIDYIMSEDSDYIYDLEKELHKLNKENKYKPKIKFNGFTECYKELPVFKLS